jgi:hypothetical protein
MCEGNFVQLVVSAGLMVQVNVRKLLPLVEKLGVQDYRYVDHAKVWAAGALRSMRRRRGRSETQSRMTLTLSQSSEGQVTGMAGD